MLRPSIKKCLLYPSYLPTFNLPYPKPFLALLEKIFFFCPIFTRKSRFSDYAAMKEKNNEKKQFPTYLPNPKIQGRGTANKQFLRMALAWFFVRFNIYRASGGPAPRVSSKERNCILLGPETSYNRWYSAC